MKSRQYWKIQGWDGCSALFEYKVYTGQITDRKLKELLKALTAKISLSEKEIISSYAKKRTKIYEDYLEVKFMKGNKFMYSCGENPYVTATAETE